MITYDNLIAQESHNKALQGIYKDDMGITAVLWKILVGKSYMESLERFRSCMRDPVTRRPREIFIPKNMCNGLRNQNKTS